MTAIELADGRIQHTNIARDLLQMAELVELCFPQMDSNGRAAVREMKSVGKLGPLLYPLAILDRIGYGIAMGYVWRQEGVVRGNVSLYRADNSPTLGRGGFYIANVAVHPDYRRRGIARMMMELSMEKIRHWGGRWICLQVERDNEAAIQLYRDFGFDSYEPLEQWLVNGLRKIPEGASYPRHTIRARRGADYAAELDLVLRRARIGSMAWTRPMQPADLTRLSSLDGRYESLVMPYPDQPERLAAAVWMSHTGWKRTRASLFIDPAVTDPALRRAPLLAILRAAKMANRIIRLELNADDAPLQDLLTESGFMKTRELLQMRLILD